jgi:DNA N-6-adenine-methyltransferase (Dam)
MITIVIKAPVAVQKATSWPQPVPGPVAADCIDGSKDERYTLPSTMAEAKAFANVDEWDVDAAASPLSHWAPKYYTAVNSGLTNPWGKRTWCNPPFSDLGPWVKKAWEEMGTGDVDTVCMLLPCNRTDQKFWHQLVEPHRDRDPTNLYGGFPGKAVVVRLRSKFLQGRTKFGQPGDLLGLKAGSPPFGCVLLCWQLVGFV